MIRPPYAARVAAGVVVTVLEETRKLPTTAITLPMTAVSQTLQTIMRFQQQIAEMAIKGDDVFDSLLGHNEEEPEWATFDDDDDSAASADSGPTAEVVDVEGDSSAVPSGSGRFALYSSAPDLDGAAATAANATDGDAPEIVELLDYDDLTLAQLRAKLKTVGLPELRDLAAYEKSHRARAPFLTMLDNRVTAASK
jgi:hypothetical protein